MIQINPKEFNELVAFVESNYGINLSKKKNLVEARLNSILAEKGFTNYAQYLDLLFKKNPQDVEKMLNALTTNHTYFMRETSHFDYFRNVVLPKLKKTKKNKTLAVWSAGCSSGEEAYTLSMILKDFFGENEGWDTRVLATDISQKAMAKAKRATYLAQDIQDIPEEWKKKYFIKTGNMYELNKVIKNNVIFQTFNLMQPIKFKVKFDVIFCRNVMIYFETDVKEALVERFYDASAPGAYLFIGHSENINKDKTRYNYVLPALYEKK